MVETVSPYPNPIPAKKNKSKLGLIIGAIVIIAAIVGSIFFFRQSKQTSNDQTNVTETNVPSPTVTPKIDKSTVKIQVQNGTGTPGQAGTAVEAIKQAGYNADNIKTANASDFNTTITTISAKAGFESVASDISNALKPTFTEIKIDSSPLDSTSEFDIVVITGGKIFETATPAVNPTSSATTPSPTLTGTTTPTPTP